MIDQPNAASVAVFDGDRVLVIQRAREPWRGLWSLPGGRLEPGEDAETCARREVMEELGLAVTGLVPVLRMEPGGPKRFVLQVFATRWFSGDISPNDEIGGFCWLRRDELAGLSTTPELAKVIAEAARLVEAS